MTIRESEVAGSESASGDMPMRHPGGTLARIITRLRERWWLIVTAILVCIGAAGAYLLVATKTYTVTAVVMAEHTRPANATDLPADAFLKTQKGVILSSAIAGANALDVRTDAAAETIAVSIESDHPSQALAALRQVIDAYMKTAGGQSMVVQKLADLSVQRDKLASDRATKDAALAEYKKQTNVSGTATDSVASARGDQLAQALAAAKKDAADAKAAGAVAVNLPTDPAQLNVLFDAARPKGAFAAVDQDRTQSSDQLKQLEALQEKQKLTLLPQHPVVVQTQKKIDLLKEHLASLDKQYPDAYRAFCAKQLAVTQGKVTEIQSLIDRQSQQVVQTSSDSQKLASLQADIKKSDDAIADVDKQIRDATQAVDSGVQMKMIQPPVAPDRPSKPDSTEILLVAGCIGLFAGLVLAMSGSRRA